jgi:hypothetical protein
MPLRVSWNVVGPVCVSVHVSTNGAIWSAGWSPPDQGCPGAVLPIEYGMHSLCRRVPATMGAPF